MDELTQMVERIGQDARRASRQLASLNDRVKSDALRAIAQALRQQQQALIEANAHDIAAAESALEGNGRLVIRPSGTEPVIRVMAEGDDRGQVESVVDRVCDAVRKAAA